MVADRIWQLAVIMHRDRRPARVSARLIPLSATPGPAGQDWAVAGGEPIQAAGWQDDAITESWTTMRVTDVRPGDHVRLASGQEMLVSRIEPNFMGMEAMVAFIEDTPTRWFKQPVPHATELEVMRKT